MRAQCVTARDCVRVRSPVYAKLIEQPAPFSIVGDSAFAHKGLLAGKIWTPLTETEMNKLPVSERKMGKAFSSAVVNMRQPAEWGNRMLLSSFPRLKTLLTVDRNRRTLLFSLCVALHNIKARRMPDTNQIHTVYAPEYVPPFGAHSVERAMNRFREARAAAKARPAGVLAAVLVRSALANVVPASTAPLIPAAPPARRSGSSNVRRKRKADGDAGRALRLAVRAALCAPE